MSSSTVDNLIAVRVLYMLVTPFEKTEAYKHGVIDKEGKLLVKIKDQTEEQKQSYDYLDRMVFNLKRLIGRLPGGKSLFASLVAALYLIKEDTKMTAAQLESQFNSILSKIVDQDVTLVEESIIVEKFLKGLEEDGAPAGVGGGGQVGVPSSNSPANVTGANVSTDIPAIRKKKQTPIAKRKLPLKV